MSQPFTGLLAYPITPLKHDGELDLAALTRLVRTAAEVWPSSWQLITHSGSRLWCWRVRP